MQDTVWNNQVAPSIELVSSVERPGPDEPKDCTPKCSPNPSCKPVTGGDIADPIGLSSQASATMSQ